MYNYTYDGPQHYSCEPAVTPEKDQGESEWLEERDGTVVSVERRTGRIYISCG